MKTMLTALLFVIISQPVFADEWTVDSNCDISHPYGIRIYQAGFRVEVHNMRQPSAVTVDNKPFDVQWILAPLGDRFITPPLTADHRKLLFNGKTLMLYDKDGQVSLIGLRKAERDANHCHREALGLTESSLQPSRLYDVLGQPESVGAIGKAPQRRRSI